MIKLTEQQIEDADVVIIGAGAAGGVLAKELSEAGVRVVVLEAGPLRDPQKDFASDELAMTALGWQETRLVDGAHPLKMGHNNSGKGVGGGTLHWTGVMLRFHASDFRTKTLDGVGEDCPSRMRTWLPTMTKSTNKWPFPAPGIFPGASFTGPIPIRNGIL